MQAWRTAFEHIFEALIREAEAGGPNASSAARKAGFLAAGVDPAREAAAWRLAAQLDPSDAAPRIALARIEARSGDLAAARAEAATAFTGARDNVDRGLAAFALGEIAERRGDKREARDAYEAAAQLARTVLDADPHDVAAAHDLASAQQRLADLDLAAGAPEFARHGHAAALALLNALAAQAPRDPGLLADRAFAHARLADIACTHNEIAEARREWAAADELYQQLAQQAPNDASLMEARAQLAALAAEIARRAGALHEALRAMEGCVALRLKLTTQYPERRPALLAAWRQQATLLAESGEIKLADAARAQAIALAEALCHEQPEADAPARDLLRLQFDEGASARARGDLEAARVIFAKACRNAEQRVARAPADGERRIDLAAAWQRLGETGLAAGRAPGAVDAFARAVEHVRPVYEAAPKDPRPARILAALLLKFGDAARAAGEHASAHTALKESFDLRLALANANGRDPAALRDVAVALEHVGLAALDAGDPAGARAAWEEELALLKRLFPEPSFAALRFAALVHAHLAGLEEHDRAAHRRAALDALDQLFAAGAGDAQDGRLRARLWSSA